MEMAYERTLRALCVTSGTTSRTRVIQTPVLQTIIISLSLADIVAAVEEARLQAGDPMADDVVVVDNKVLAGESRRNSGYKRLLISVQTLRNCHTPLMSIMVLTRTSNRESFRTGMVAPGMQVQSPPASVTINELSCTVSTLQETIAVHGCLLAENERDRQPSLNDNASVDPNCTINRGGGAPRRNERVHGDRE